jgi:hypothetical protein
MQINPQGTQQPIRISKPEDSLAASVGQPREEASEAKLESKVEMSVVRPLSVSGLAAQLKNDSGIREGVVTQIQEKMKSGYYQSAEALVDTANSILDS